MSDLHYLLSLGVTQEEAAIRIGRSPYVVATELAATHDDEDSDHA